MDLQQSECCLQHHSIKRRAADLISKSYRNRGVATSTFGSAHGTGASPGYPPLAWSSHRSMPVAPCWYRPKLEFAEPYGMHDCSCLALMSCPIRCNCKASNCSSRSFCGLSSERSISIISQEVSLHRGSFRGHIEQHGSQYHKYHPNMLKRAQLAHGYNTPCTQWPLSHK